MENYTDNFGSWQSNCSGAVSLVPAFAASNIATGLPFAGAVRADVTVAGLGQPTAMATGTRTDKSIAHPGSPPRGRLR